MYISPIGRPTGGDKITPVNRVQPRPLEEKPNEKQSGENFSEIFDRVLEQLKKEK